MKRKWLGLALAAAMACAGAATQSTADILAEDSAMNYTAETFVSGANGGTGFGAWDFWNAAPTLADSTAGVCGDVNSETGVSFRFARDADHEWCNGYRGFEALNPGDVLTFRFTCAYCAGGRGLDLFANGGHSDEDKIANVIHLSGDNEYSVNGVVIANNWAPHAVSEVTVSQLENGIEIAIKRTSTEPGVEDLEYSTTVETSAKLTGIGLYAGGWDWNGGADIENYAFYVNDLKIEGVPPADKLSLAGPDGDAWKVLSATGELEFTVSRTGTEGDLEVALKSSYPEFVSVPESVTIADGETSQTFPVTVALQGYGNEATISASATAVSGAEYGLKGPQYRISATEQVQPGVKANFWVDWDNNGMRDDSKLTLAIEPEDVDFVADGPESWQWNDKKDEEGNLVGAYVEAQFTANDSARMVLKFDGVEMWGADVTVLKSGATLSGPTSLRVGNEATYTLAVTLAGDIESDTFQLVADDDSLVSIEPTDAQELTESGSLKFTVTALAEGEVMLSVVDDKGLDADIAPLTVTISEAPDYSKYIAYDDASLYTDGFDFSSTGAGQEGFGAWSVYKDSAEFGGAIITGDAAGFPAILSDGSAFAIYANGSNPDYAIVRPFANDLQPGQEASIEFVVPTSGGSRYIQFARIWEGTPYNRCEIWANGGAVGINVDGGDSQELGWSVNARRVVASLKRAADGSDYTLNLAGYNEGSEFPDDVFQYVINADVGSWGEGLQGIVIGGYDLGSDFIFNTLSIEQVEEPIVERAIGWAAGVWNPDAAGEYKFAISATTEDIGEVALSVTPAEGALSLSTDSVDLTGVTEASFAVILSEANEGDSFVITATPADTTVAPIEYNVTVSASYVTLSSDAWEYPVSAGEIWLALSASVSKYGTYAITSSDEAVLAVPEASEAITVGSPDPSWFNVTIVGPGKATIYATAEGEETPAAEYTFTVIADAPSIDGTTIEVSFADGDGLSGKVDDTLRDQFKDVKAQVLQWNGVDGFDEVEVLENEAEWPDMQFTPSIDNPVIRLIFVK